jgi:hypothetical protein
MAIGGGVITSSLISLPILGGKDIKNILCCLRLVFLPFCSRKKNPVA